MLKTTNNTKLKIKNLEIGMILKGKVIAKKRNEMFIDLSPFGIGRLYGIYYIQNKNLVQKLNVGDTTGVKILGFDDGNGYYEVSLTDVSSLDVWEKLLNYYQKKEILTVEIKDVNKGGWLTEVEGIKAFIPLSQLSPEYYPRVDPNNKNLIYEHLKKFIGQKIKCRIFSLDPKTNKLILSEKLSKEEDYNKVLSQLIVGDIYEVKIVGISPFGLFVRFHENPPIDGLIHISEIPKEKIDLEKNFSIGEVLKAKIIQIKQDRVNFSLKDLTIDPWVNFVKNYKVGDIVDGVVREKNDIFAVIEAQNVQGVSLENLDKLEVGQNYKFIIEKIESQNKNLILKIKE